MSGRHPGSEELAVLAVGGLDEAERRRLEEHARSCQACADELERLREAVAEIPPPPVPDVAADVVDGTWRAILREVEDEAARRATAAASRRPGRDVRPTRAGRPRGTETERHADRPSRTALRGRLAGWLFGPRGPRAPRWAARAAQVVVLLTVGFSLAWFAAGRGWLPGSDGSEGQGPARSSRGVRRDAARGLLATSGYGDRLETLLIGISRGDGEGPTITPAAREVGRELLEDSRWYRQAAVRSGDAALEELLARMETILLALVTVPEGQEQRLVEGVRTVIEEDDLLWRLRTVRQSVPAPPDGATTAGRGS